MTDIEHSPTLIDRAAEVLCNSGQGPRWEQTKPMIKDVFRSKINHLLAKGYIADPLKPPMCPIDGCPRPEGWED